MNLFKQKIGDRQGEARSINNLGLAYGRLGQYQKAIELYQQSLTIAREIGDRTGEANSLGNLGIADNNLGQYHQVLKYYQQWLAITREIGDRNPPHRSDCTKCSGEANRTDRGVLVYDSRPESRHPGT